MRAAAAGVIAVVAAISALTVWGCGTSTPTAGFWYDDSPFALPAPAAEKLGGLLTSRELESIKEISRAELERAYAGFRIRINDDSRSFWRVEVVRSLRGRGPLPDAGESRSFGWMGGAGGGAFDLVGPQAVQYAPQDAPG